MARTRAELEEAAKHLSIQDRALLVRSLIASLDEGNDKDVEEAWLAEAERRYHMYRGGLNTPKSADEVLKEAKSRLK